jgi:hypothetical protein
MQRPRQPWEVSGALHRPLSCCPPGAACVTRASLCSVSVTVRRWIPDDQARLDRLVLVTSVTSDATESSPELSTARDDGLPAVKDQACHPDEVSRE